MNGHHDIGVEISSAMHYSMYNRVLEVIWAGGQRRVVQSLNSGLHLLLQVKTNMMVKAKLLHFSRKTELYITFTQLLKTKENKIFPSRHNSSRLHNL